MLKWYISVHAKFLFVFFVYILMFYNISFSVLKPISWEELVTFCCLVYVISVRILVFSTHILGLCFWIFIRDVRKPNFGSVLVFKKQNRSLKVKPEILVSMAFLKTELVNMSHSHKTLTFFTLRTLSDSKWSWNQIISWHHAIIS